jgi:hypothetical protein
MQPRHNNYRGRRLYAYDAVNELHQIIDALGVEEDRTILPIPDTKMPPPPSEAVKLELHNMATSLLRLILAHNDGQLSPTKLQGY